MGLFDAIGQGLSAAGYAAGDMLAKGALMDTQNQAELQRMQRLEEYKSALKLAQQQTILSGGSMVDALNARAGVPPSGGSAGSAATSGATTSATSAPAGAGNSATDIAGLAKKYNVPEEALRYDLAMNEGKGIADMIAKGAKGNKQFHNGMVVDMDRAPEGLVDGQVYTDSNGHTIVIRKGADGQPQVVVPQGALEAQAAQQGVAAGVKAGTTPIKVFNPTTGREEFTSEASALNLPGAGSAPAPQRAAPAAPGGSTKPQPGDSDRVAILNEELAKNQRMLANPRDYMSPAAWREDPDGSQFVRRVQNDIAGIQRELQRAGGGTPAGQSTKEKLSQEAQGELNKSAVKTFDEVRAGGAAADDVLTSVGVARDALKKMGGTGWGSETKKQAAEVLAAMGVKGANDYATSAQQFQSAAMTRLWSTLNNAKGPQTEGDADRAKQTFATLRNTTQANEFILDLAQANAERDKIKANFYAAATPAARDSGDLTSVDRAWRERAPSVFNMPSMQRWGVKNGASAGR